jgi:hypothetical protein
MLTSNRSGFRHCSVGGGLRMRHFGGPQGAGPRKDDGGQWRAP